MTYVTHQNINLKPIWQKKGPRLPSLDIELTERCNNACQHCYINLAQGDEGARGRELATGEWQGILRQAAELGALTVRLTGGEPLLREDFGELYTFARRLGIKVQLFTNARRITPELAWLFRDVPPLEKIEVTVYGMRPESYDAAACAPGAYEEFRRGVELLLEYRIPFIVKGALLPSNRAEMDELEAWAATIPWMDEPVSYAMSFDLRGRRDLPAKNRLIEKLRLSPEQVMATLKRNEARYRKEMGEFCGKFMGPGGDKLFGCGAGSSLSVDAYGRCQACMLLRDPALSYDLRTGSLREASEIFFPKLQDRRATNPEYLERCGRCFLHGLCEQCPAKAWSEHGSLDTPVEYLCEVAHAQARYLGLLWPGERAWEVENWKERLPKEADNGF